MIIMNLYFKISIMQRINIIISTLYALIYLVNFIYAIQASIPVEMFYYFIGLLLSILVIIESIKIIKH
jgi:hypothetical protein